MRLAVYNEARFRFSWEDTTGGPLFDFNGLLCYECSLSIKAVVGCSGMITLLSGFPQSESPARVSEFNHCLSVNLKNPCLDRMIILAEEAGPRDLPITDSAPFPVEVKRLFKRSNFQDYIDTVNEMVGDGVAVFANSDIRFDWSIDKLRFIPENTLCAITRNDCGNLGSSDAWAFRPPLPITGCNWWLGRLGCESAFISKVQRTGGWRVWNPYRSVLIYHAHWSGVRFGAWNWRVGYGAVAPPVTVLFDEKTKTFKELA